MYKLFITSFLLFDCATTAVTTPGPAAAPSVQVPDALKVAPDRKLALEAHAKGVQIYQCKAKSDDPAKYEWALKAPEAELTGAGGAPVGKHYAGPTWESTDGSKVVGQVKARDPGPDASAIPWLLLEAKSTSGDGVLGRITAIQRVDTVGGKAPADGCSREAEGKEARVSYKARYLFYRAP